MEPKKMKLLSCLLFFLNKCWEKNVVCHCQENYKITLRTK